MSTSLNVPDWLTEPSRDLKRILFVRHGEYICNVLKVGNGNPRIPHSLTDLGREQARQVGLRLANEGIEALVTSEYLRARETANHINETLRLPQMVNRLANECRLGPAMEGQPTMLAKRAMACDPANSLCCEGSESFVQMQARIEALISDMVLSSPKTILVVTHGWTLQIVRVLKGEITQREGALNIGMPGNCEVVEGFFNHAGWVPTPASRRA
jgi:broad specificity phosphatase PhoE